MLSIFLLCCPLISDCTSRHPRRDLPIYHGLQIQFLSSNVVINRASPQLARMDPEQIQEQVESARELLEDTHNITAFIVSSQPFQGFILENMSLSAAVERGLDAGAEQFYLVEDRDEEGNLTLGGVCFFVNRRPHTIYKQTEERLESVAAGDESSSAGRRGLGYDSLESEEEKQRKQDIAEELLNEYDEYLNEDEKFEIENRLERMRLRRILSIQQRVEEEASADPEEEKRIARAVYEDDRFNRQFNEMDTEMLLDDLDVEFDPNKIRPDEVHKRAKSLLKINR